MLIHSDVRMLDGVQYWYLATAERSTLYVMVAVLAKAGVHDARHLVITMSIFS